MATVDELVKQYETDEKLQKEVADIVADGKIPKYTEQARKLGFIK